MHIHKVKNCGVGFNYDVETNAFTQLLYSRIEYPMFSAETCDLNGHTLLCMFLGDDFSRHQIFSAQQCMSTRVDFLC